MSYEMLENAILVEVESYGTTAVCDTLSILRHAAKQRQDESTSESNRNAWESIAESLLVFGHDIYRMHVPNQGLD